MPADSMWGSYEYDKLRQLPSEKLRIDYAKDVLELSSQVVGRFL